MSFIGREQELAVLDRAYDSAESAFIPVYGRRRVGKSELILRFIKNKPALYFLGKQAPAELQRREFLEIAAREMNEPLLATFPAQTWREVLMAITERRPRDKKFVFVFDEFQWTAEASPELPSVLQEMWDLHWRTSGEVMLILCGSYLGFMEREVLGSKSPLFGRRTAQILLRPFDYRTATAFHPGYSLVDQAKAYFICGGVPLYLRFFSQSASIESNIIDQIIDPYSAMYREPDFLLREELRDVERYYAILLAIATGHATHQAIASTSGIAARNLNYYLKHIIELGYVAKRYPLTGATPNPRRVRYVIEEPLLRFWFRFVFPIESTVAKLGAELAYKELIAPVLEAYFGLCFERLCREALPTVYAREGVRTAYEMGEYWDKHTQIDVVGWRRDGWTDLGECKWGTVRAKTQIEAELEQKVARYPNPRNATIGRRVFCRRKPPSCSENDPVRWYDLADLYS